MMTLTIWANAFLTPLGEDLLRESTKQHRLIIAEKLDNVLAIGASDPRLQEAEVLFGQPDPKEIIRSSSVCWVHLSSAGYTRYDTAEFRSALQARPAIFTNSSSVYDEPCAEHLMAFLLADARQLHWSYENQRGARGWPQNPIRERSRLLSEQTILIVGYGAIGERLAELLVPYSATVIGYRRKHQSTAPIPIIGSDQLSSALAEADHVMNTLPESASTRHFFDSERFERFKPGARYYSIGRGATTDQEALRTALISGRLAAAYLDVTDPEPLPPDHPLWSLPNCYITPHTGGGHVTEPIRTVQHFIDNLRRYERGEPLVDLVW
jgi:phosphoglycerate dehydrogenase-like enzyme